MRVYLACGLEHEAPLKYASQSYILESFYALPKRNYPYIKKCKDIIIDSGAFTFMTSQKNKKIDFDEYASNYAKFLKRFDIDKYFELDIDVIKGVGYVEEVRRFLENETHKPSIPVWHKSRGIDYFKQMCKNYDYVAIGGIVSREIKPNEYPKLIPLINYAHQTNTKIHGLGFTVTATLDRFKWDSVDSSSWTYSTRYRNISYFDKKTKAMVYFKPPNKRIKDRDKLLELTYLEWLKYQRYAEKNL